MQHGSHTVDLTNVRPREINSQGVRGRYRPVVPTLAYIQRKRASINNPNTRNARITRSESSLPSGSAQSSAKQPVPSSDRGDTGRGKALDGQEDITQDDRIDLLEFSALSTCSNVRLFPICQIKAQDLQLLNTSSMNDLFTQQDSKMDLDSPKQSPHGPDWHARNTSPDPELAEFAALSQLPAIFGPNHPSLPTTDNG